jgi:hypothetical protein
VFWGGAAGYHQVCWFFSAGQPDSEQTWVFIIALSAIARQEGKRAEVIIWDNTSWHNSQRLESWIRSYNQAAKPVGEPRLITHLLPLKSPWLDPSEPRWVHARRGVCEPNSDLSPVELRRRLCCHFRTEALANSFKL